ncbi:alpha/beta hydrolase [Pedobacter panaciterrae]|jgi:Esterase/lipase|uniref:alpha/beta hydrolase n=1 Tax=Pedobacter panaciterrae TaxID=363849 RepID=UPI00155D9451|nr:alpha/beta hydrolase [Pedobacter panaciterrae]NQX54947.1 alpha/beta hydrolase [Pedobacter panaciterrae]
MKYFTSLLMILMCTANLNAQEIVKLYPGVIPGSKPAPADFKETAPVGDDGIIRISKVSEPTLTVFLPSKEKATGAAVIICPGGGYGILAINHEGYNVAKRFNDIGVAAFVLKYRLPNDAIMVDKSFGPLLDAEQAIYLVRGQAKKWNVDPAKIGIMGFSAGGHLASTLTVHYNDVKIENKEKLSLRPDFSILIYPVISFIESPHTGSANNLAGANATQAQKEYFSNEKHVTPQTPPTFLVHANDDNGVPVQNSIIFNQALVANKVKAEMHLYQGGGHGFGLNNKTTSDDWFERLTNWMKSNKFL